MRTVTFKSVIDGALARMGLDPSITPASNTLAAFTEYLNSNLRAAWEMYPWPDFVCFELRQFYPDWNASTTYAANAVVLGSDGIYYYAKTASTGVNPITDTADINWAPASSYTSTTGSGILYAIDLDQVLGGVTQTPIGEVLNVWASDPRTNRYSTPVNWWLTNDGIVCGEGSAGSFPAEVWVEFTARPTVYTTASYSNGDTIPYVVAEAVKFGICAEAQREDGQFDKAGAMDAAARECLNIEWDKLEMKQGQQGRFSAMSR
jgi:hypothetical protein